MRARVLLAALVLGVPAYLASAAGAGACATAGDMSYGVVVHLCVAESGCTVYQDSVSMYFHQHSPVCLP